MTVCQFFSKSEKSNTAAGALKISKWGKNAQNLQLSTCKFFSFHSISFLYNIKNVHSVSEDICKFRRVILIFMAVSAISVLRKSQFHQYKEIFLNFQNDPI